MNDTFNVVTISESTLEGYIKAMEPLNPETDRLCVESLPLDVDGLEFVYGDKTYVVTGIDSEDREEPLLSAMLKGFTEYEYDVTEDGVISGYYSIDESRGNHFPTDYISHSGWSFSSRGRFARNIPGIEDGALIGFYWIPLSGVMSILKNPNH
ncbi:hypothetical protein [Paenibacillus taichungensis]